MGSQALASTPPLAHPNVPDYIEHFVIDDVTLVLVMEEAPGEPLSRRIGIRSVTSDELVAWLVQGLEVLVYLHGRQPQVLHRDVTIHNLLVDGARLSLIDFGAVKASLVSSTTVTSVGTFGFMAPEQLRGLAVPASDLYGLGVSILCAAAGVGPDKLPVDEETATIDVRAIPGLPPAVRPILARMVGLGLNARYPTAARALAELRAALARPEASATPVKAPAPMPDKLPPPSRRALWIMLALAFIGLGIYGIAKQQSALGGFAIFVSLFFVAAAASNDEGDPEG